MSFQRERKTPKKDDLAKKLGQLWEEECGQGMVEYAFILALVALTVIGGLAVLGQGVLGLFENVLDKDVFSSTLSINKTG